MYLEESSKPCPICSTLCLQDQIFPNFMLNALVHKSIAESTSKSNTGIKRHPRFYVMIYWQYYWHQLNDNSTLRPTRISKNSESTLTSWKKPKIRKTRTWSPLTPKSHPWQKIFLQSKNGSARFLFATKKSNKNSPPTLLVHRKNTLYQLLIPRMMT